MNISPRVLYIIHPMEEMKQGQVLTLITQRADTLKPKKNRQLSLTHID